jgi:hypothetical protein
MSIVITKNSLNQIALTLTELEDSSIDINWLFRFVHEQGKSEILVYLSDLNSSFSRYNLFHLLEGTDATFTKLGDYIYEVYQMPDGGSLDYSLGLRCEIGKMTVKDSIIVVPNSFEPTKQANIYGGETIS